MAACVEAAVQRFGGLDIAVLNAGIEGEVQPITDYDIATFDRVMAVNVRGVWLGLKYCIPAHRQARRRQHRDHLIGGRPERAPTTCPPTAPANTRWSA